MQEVFEYRTHSTLHCRKDNRKFHFQKLIRAETKLNKNIFLMQEHVKYWAT